MPNGLTYPSLKCVLEHLEANKRISLSFQCPALQQADKTTPLHLNKLTFDEAKLTLNEITYELNTVLKFACGLITHDHPYAVNQDGERDKEAEKVLMPGDMLWKPFEQLEEWYEADDEINNIDFDDRNNYRLPIYSRHLQLVHIDETSEMKYKKRLPNHLEFHVALKRLTTFLLGGRCIIRVKTLEFLQVYHKIIRLPVGLRIRAKELEIISDPLDELVQMLNEPNYHLQKMKIGVYRDYYAQLPLFKTAEKVELQLFGDDESWLKDVRALTNKEVCLLDRNKSEKNLLAIVQSLLDDSRDIDQMFTIQFLEEGNLKKSLHGIRKRFNGQVTRIRSSLLECISIPKSSTLELCIYENPEDPKQACIKVLPIGSTTPVKHDFWYFLMVHLELDVHIEYLNPIYLLLFVGVMYSFFAIYFVILKRVFM